MFAATFQLPVLETRKLAAAPLKSF